MSGEIAYPFQIVNGATVEVGSGQVISRHDKITYPSPNFNSATVKIGNGQVSPPHTLLSMWLLIHTGIKAWRNYTRTTINKHNKILSIFDDRDCHKDHLSYRQWCNGALSNPNLYLDQPITKILMPANWKLCLIPNWQSYCHQAGTV